MHSFRCDRSVTWRTAQARVVIASLLFASTACNTVDSTVPIIDVDRAGFYWALKLNHQVVTLSTHTPWDTAQLEGFPYNVQGDTLSREGVSVQYTSSDSSVVRVLPNGALQARKVGTGVNIIARLTLGNITHIDTTRVKVVNNPAPGVLQLFSIHPIPPDSAKIARSDLEGDFLVSQFLIRQAADGRQMTEILVDYRWVGRGLGNLTTAGAFGVNSRKVGTAKIVASTYAYGVSAADTLLFTVGHSLQLGLTFMKRQRLDGLGTEVYLQPDGIEGDPLGSNTAKMGVGGEFSLYNYSGDTVDISFGDTTNIVGVDRTADGFGCGIRPVNSSNRPISDPLSDFEYCPHIVSFTKPGIYQFRDLRSGTSGRIEIIDESVRPTAPTVNRRTP